LEGRRISLRRWDGIGGVLNSNGATYLAFEFENKEINPKNKNKKQNCRRTSSSGVEPSLSPFCATDIYIIISPTFNRERSRVWLEHAQVKNV